MYAVRCVTQSRLSQDAHRAECDERVPHTAKLRAGLCGPRQGLLSFVHASCFVCLTSHLLQVPLVGKFVVNSYHIFCLNKERQVRSRMPFHTSKYAEKPSCTADGQPTLDGVHGVAAQEQDVECVARLFSLAHGTFTSTAASAGRRVHSWHYCILLEL